MAEIQLFPREQVVGIFRGFQQGGMEFHADLVLPYRNELKGTQVHVFCKKSDWNGVELYVFEYLHIATYFIAPLCETCYVFKLWKKHREEEMNIGDSV